MTIAAAFRCRTGGVLLCADREEDDGYNKREVDKIYRIPVTELQTCDVFVTGAGPSSLINKLNAELHEVLYKSKVSRQDVFGKHRDLIESQLASFYKRYTKELKETPMGLILVVAPFDSRYIPLMYHSEHAILIPDSEYRAYGTGKALSDYFADRLFRWDRMDKGALAILAAFILRETETSASGIGLGNDMVFIHDGDKSLHFIPKDYVKKLQEGIPTLSDAINGCWQQNVKIPDWIYTTVRPSESQTSTGQQ